MATHYLMRRRVPELVSRLQELRLLDLFPLGFMQLMFLSASDLAFGSAQERDNFLRRDFSDDLRATLRRSAKSASDIISSKFPMSLRFEGNTFLSEPHFSSIF